MKKLLPLIFLVACNLPDKVEKSDVPQVVKDIDLLERKRSREKFFVVRLATPADTTKSLSDSIYTYLYYDTRHRVAYAVEFSMEKQSLTIFFEPGGMYSRLITCYPTVNTTEFIYAKYDSILFKYRLKDDLNIDTMRFISQEDKECIKHRLKLVKVNAD